MRCGLRGRDRRYNTIKTNTRQHATQLHIKQIQAIKPHYNVRTAIIFIQRNTRLASIFQHHRYIIQKEENITINKSCVWITLFKYPGHSHTQFSALCFVVLTLLMLEFWIEIRHFYCNIFFYTNITCAERTCLRQDILLSIHCKHKDIRSQCYHRDITFVP